MCTSTKQPPNPLYSSHVESSKDITPTPDTDDGTAGSDARIFARNGTNAEHRGDSGSDSVRSATSAAAYPRRSGDRTRYPGAGAAEIRGIAE